MVYTYENEMTKTLLTLNVGNDIVTVIERLDRSEVSGKWVVMVNGIARRWYAMPAAALRIAKKYRIGNYGGSFGECVNPTGKMC